jgi:hypothetical protein
MQSISTMETLLDEQPLSKTEDVSETGTITFCAYDPKHQLPVTCRPSQDHTGKLWTGQGKHGYFELLSAEEKVNLPFIFNYDTSVIIEDGKVLNMLDPMDKATWKWLRHHKYIALDKKEGLGNRDAVFYVANAQKEAQERIDKSAKTDQARPAVRQLSQEDQVRIAKALGLDGAAGFSPSQVLDWLLAKCNTSPETVLATIAPENSKRVNATMFAKDALKYGVTTREKDGGFYFGGADGVSLGHTEEMVVDYLLNPVNVERVKAMKAMFMEKSKQTVE